VWSRGLDGESITGTTSLNVVTNERVSEDILEMGLLMMYSKRAVRRSYAVCSASRVPSTRQLRL
jgi:hypothetical protein